MEDRFTPGLFAGVIGDAFLQIYFSLLSVFKIISRTYADYGEILIMAKAHEGPLAYVIGVTLEFIIGGLLGIVFAYLLKYTTTKFYMLKAVCLAMASWLFFLVPGTLYKLALFEKVPPQDSFLMLIGSILWSIITAIAFKYLTDGFKVFYTE